MIELRWVPNKRDEQSIWMSWRGLFRQQRIKLQYREGRDNSAEFDNGFIIWTNWEDVELEEECK